MVFHRKKHLKLINEMYNLLKSKRIKFINLSSSFKVATFLENLKTLRNLRELKENKKILED